MLVELLKYVSIVGVFYYIAIKVNNSALRNFERQYKRAASELIRRGLPVPEKLTWTEIYLILKHSDGGVMDNSVEQ